MVNGIAFAALLGKPPQAIDVSDPSGAGGSRALSPEARQKRQCALLGARVEGQVPATPLSADDFAAFPVFPTEVVAVPRKPTRYQWGWPRFG
jgi:hypothetical protein